jgi:hypothetical protein
MTLQGGPPAIELDIGVDRQTNRTIPGQGWRSLKRCGLPAVKRDDTGVIEGLGTTFVLHQGLQRGSRGSSMTLEARLLRKFTKRLAQTLQ